MAGQQPQPNPAPPEQQDPPAVQPPDHRWDDVQKAMRELQTQNAQLRGQIDILSKGQQAAPQEKSAAAAFDPKVAAAIETLIDSKLQPFQVGMRDQLGMLYDKQDEIGYRTQYGSERFQKFNERVEQIRHEEQLKGKWVPREEALRIAHFEQTGRKPQADKPAEQAAAQVKFDPYLGQWLDAEGKQTAAPMLNQQGQQIAPEPPPVQQPAQQQAQQQAPQPVGQPQALNPMAQLPPPAQAPQQMPPNGIPAEVPFQQLPTQGLNPQNPVPEESGHQQLTMDATQEELDRFASAYGDIPL